jgi:protein tyrosine phosphatase (PTP) superfamily phosphohydrolase (DUF442 family)
MPGTEAAPQTVAPTAKPSVPGRLRRHVFRGCIAVVLLAVGAEGGRVVLGSNFHTLLPGRVYRCAQPSGADLERLIAAHGIRTVVNLRGCCSTFPWYLDECRASQHLDIAHEDIFFSAGRVPPTHEVRRLIDVLDRAEYPLLLHCRRGADRTGLAAAVVALLYTDASLGQARRQLGLRYGHVAIGRPGNLDHFFDLYADWLRERGLEHAPGVFRRWATREYTAGAYSAAITPLDVPAVVRRGEPFAVRVRVRNTGNAGWRLRPAANAGVHLAYMLWDAHGRQLGTGRAGLFDADVAPGASIDLTLSLPPLEQAGNYRLLVDMTDEQQCWFYQAGSEPLEEELQARD